MADVHLIEHYSVREVHPTPDLGVNGKSAVHGGEQGLFGIATSD
jgi:hypothetical protein